jgi:hypothetical protein
VGTTAVGVDRLTEKLAARQSVLNVSPT